MDPKVVAIAVVVSVMLCFTGVESFLPEEDFENGEELGFPVTNLSADEAFTILLQR